MSRKRPPPRLSDAAALLAAVWASPHSDTPRLVYADCIEDRGDPGDAERAEFIRLQIAREAAEALGDDVSDEMHWREEGLFQSHKAAWLAETGEHFTEGYVRTADHRAAMVRGFAVRHRNTSASLLPKRPLDPPLTSLELSWVAPGGLTKLARSPHGATIHRLESVLNTSYEAGKCAALVELTGITELRLQVYGAGGLALAEWVAGLDLPRLRRLTPPRCETAGGLVRALASSPAAHRLTELDLCHTTLGPAALRRLGDSGAFRRLRALRVNGETTDQMAAFLASPLASRLRELHVAAHDWQWVFCRAFAAAPLPGLRVLRIESDYRPINPDDARVLASERLGGLRELHVTPPDGRGPVSRRLKSALGDRLRPAHLWQAVPAG